MSVEASSIIYLCGSNRAERICKKIGIVVRAKDFADLQRLLLLGQQGLRLNTPSPDLVVAEPASKDELAWLEALYEEGLPCPLLVGRSNGAARSSAWGWLPEMFGETLVHSPVTFLNRPLELKDVRHAIGSQRARLRTRRSRRVSGAKASKNRRRTKRP